MYELWYDYVKPNYGEKEELCYINTGSFIVYIKTDDIYKKMTEDVETRSLNEFERPLPNTENKKVISLMKDELGGKIIIEFI